MKKIQNRRRLALDAQTLRRLQGLELAGIAGGGSALQTCTVCLVGLAGCETGNNCETGNC